MSIFKGEAAKKKPAPAKKSGKKKLAADSSDNDDEPAADVPKKVTDFKIKFETKKSGFRIRIRTDPHVFALVGAGSA